MAAEKKLVQIFIILKLRLEEIVTGSKFEIRIFYLLFY